jgi:hypothetical protein
MTRKRAELGEIHWKALSLMEQGNLSRKEIAKECGWGEDYFYDLCEGRIEKCGYTAELFKNEIKKIDKKKDDLSKSLIKANTVAAQELIQRTLSELKSKSKHKLEEKKLIATLTNALAKCTPNVSVSNLSFSYTKGLNPEELIYEFKRLKAIAECSPDRRRVPEVIEGGSGELSASDE